MKINREEGVCKLRRGSEKVTGVDVEKGSKQVRMARGGGEGLDGMGKARDVSAFLTADWSWG
jgi:hypothetical protein